MVNRLPAAEAAYQREGAEQLARDYADEAAAEEAFTDDLYGSLETLPGTVVRGLGALDDAFD